MKYDIIHDHGMIYCVCVETDEGYSLNLPCEGFMEEDVIKSIKNFDKTFKIDEYATSLWQTSKRKLEDCLNEAKNIYNSFSKLSSSL